jgi:hypothetical protein
MLFAFVLVAVLAAREDEDELFGFTGTAFGIP